MNLKQIIATIPTPTERAALFAALYSRYAMWEESFVISVGGDIVANASWWRARNLWKQAVWIEIHAYCKGWVDARKSFKS